MILICGTQLSADALPFGDFCDYVVEEGVLKTDVKLKTIAKGSSCVKVYLHSSFSNIALEQRVADKTVFFEDDAELIKLLSCDCSEELNNLPEPDVELKEEELELNSSEEGVCSVVEVGMDFSNFEAVSDVELEEVDTDLTAELLTIPIIGNDVDILKKQLEQKDLIISQKDLTIKDLNNERDDIYKMQESQLLEIQDLYIAKIDEANSSIKTLKERLSEDAVSAEDRALVKYTKYAESNKALLRDTLTKDELHSLGKITSKVYIVSAGSGESTYSMLQNVDSLLNTNSDAIIVDFSGDAVIKNKRGISTKRSSLELNSDGVDVESLVQMVSNTRYISTTSYHDIVLLTVNWGKVIRSLMDYAGGKPLILLFGSISSFNVKYTVAKLGSMFESIIVTNSHPFSLIFLMSEYAYMQDSKARVVAVGYFDEIKILLEKFSEKYVSCKLNAYSKNIDWAKELANKK